tara:strand:+ start:4011 stop:4700 length:690 start_codon:yes stop_codon:yes gene_type:complete
MANFSKNHPQISQRTIEDFKSKLIGGAARPNMFEVELQFPSFVEGGSDTKMLDNSRFLVKAANLPASNINVIEVPFRGRNLKIAGDRTFDVWTITVINDIDFGIRNAFERWMNGINKHDNATGYINPAQYQCDARVHQLGRNTIGSVNTAQPGPGNAPIKAGSNVPVLKSYLFHGVFPTNVGAIEVSYDNSDTIEEFTVDLQVQWWDALNADGKTILRSEEEVVQNTQL